VCVWGGGRGDIYNAMTKYQLPQCVYVAIWLRYGNDWASLFFQTHQNLSGALASSGVSSAAYDSPLSSSSPLPSPPTPINTRQSPTRSPSKGLSPGSGQGKKRTLLPTPKSPARRNIALENMAPAATSPRVASPSGSNVTEAGSKVDSGEATCSPGVGSVAVMISGYQSPAHFYIQLEEKAQDLQKSVVVIIIISTCCNSNVHWHISHTPW
jgi:hypothetical protein